MKFETTLAVDPGEGILARRSSSILFVPEPDDSGRCLVQAFFEAGDGEAWATVSQTVMEGSFSSSPFVCVDFSRQITLRLFGDVSVTTDLPSVPMLSGAGSSTWVEHTAPGSESLSAPASIRFGASGTTGDAVMQVPLAGTDLRSGIVPAGGFTLLVRPTVATVRSDDTEPPNAETETETARPDRVTLALDVLGPPEADELAEADVEDDRTLPPPEPAAGSATPIVTARLCGDGHPNRPSRLTCSECDAFLTPGEEGLQLVARPVVATLVFDDGIKVDVDKPVVIGRSPEVGERTCGEHVERLVFDSDRVSRTHLEVRLSEWDVVVVDHGSRNGTVVVPANGAQPVKVDPKAPQLVEPGAVVYFGTRSFTLR